MDKKIGIIGSTGRMGVMLKEILHKTEFASGLGFSRTSQSLVPIEKVYQNNDYIVDFSHADFIETVLTTAITTPKPLILCSTGWSIDNYQDLVNKVSKVTPIVIAPNTSIGVYLQRYLIKQLAKLLGPAYDIDIIEKHHHHKIDIPSGTTTLIANDIKQIKKQFYNVDYQVAPLTEGKRPKHLINTHSIRSGEIFGEHEVSFTNAEEMLTIKHVAFNRKLFARGVFTILKWLKEKNPKAGIYTIEDVLQ